MHTQIRNKTRYLTWTK